MQKRYQREIEEILKQAGDFKGPGRDKRPRIGLLRLTWLYLVRSLGGKGLSLSPGRIVLLAVSLLLSALIFKAIAPGLVGPLAFAGLLLFIVGYGLFFVKPPKIEKRWRGQSLEDGGVSWWDRFRRKRN